MFEDDEIPPPPPLLDAHRIIAFSLDADGCLFNEKYMLYDKVIAGNTALLSHMIRQAEYIKQLIILVGSNRQSHHLDQFNSTENKTMSCFLAVEKITSCLSTKLSHQNVGLDRFLMADIYHDLEAGTAFTQAIDPCHLGPHSDAVFDRSKITLLYAQIHKLANDHKGKRIIYNFYDDKYELLSGLNNFFQDHLEWIPINVKVHLHYYIGDEPYLLVEISGTGALDRRYRDHVKWMANLSYQFPVAREGFDAIEAFIHYERYNSCHLQMISPQEWVPTGLLTLCDSTFFKPAPSIESCRASPKSKAISLPQHPSEPIKKNPLYFLMAKSALLGLSSVVEPDFQLDINNQIKFAKLDISKPLAQHRSIDINRLKYTIERHYIIVDETYRADMFYSDYCYIAHLTTTPDCLFSLRALFNAQDTSVEVSLFNETTGQIISIPEPERYYLNALAVIYCADILGPLRHNQSVLEYQLIQQTNAQINHLLSLPTHSKENLETCIALSNALLSHQDEFEYHKQLHVCLNLVFQYKRMLDLKYTALISEEYDIVDSDIELCFDDATCRKTSFRLPECVTSLKMSRLNHRLGVKINQKPTELAYFEAANDAIAALATFTEEMTIDNQSIALVYNYLIESIDASIQQLHRALLIGDNVTVAALSQFAPLLPYTIFKKAIDSPNTFLLKWLLQNEHIAINRVRVEYDERQYSLLEYAFMHKKLSCFELLLKHGASPMVFAANDHPLAYLILSHESEFNTSLSTYLNRVSHREFWDQLPTTRIDSDTISP